MLNFLKSVRASDYIAILALAISLISLLNSNKQQNFTESSYYEERRSEIRVLLNENEATLNDLKDRASSLLLKIPASSKAYSYIIDLKKNIDDTINDITFMLENLDKPVFSGDIAFWNFIESSMKAQKVNISEIVRRMEIIEKDPKLSPVKPEKDAKAILRSELPSPMVMRDGLTVALGSD